MVQSLFEVSWDYYYSRLFWYAQVPFYLYFAICLTYYFYVVYNVENTVFNIVGGIVIMIFCLGGVCQELKQLMK